MFFPPSLNLCRRRDLFQAGCPHLCPLFLRGGEEEELAFCGLASELGELGGVDGGDGDLLLLCLGFLLLLLPSLEDEVL